MIQLLFTKLQGESFCLPHGRVAVWYRRYVAMRPGKVERWHYVLIAALGALGVAWDLDFCAWWLGELGGGGSSCGWSPGLKCSWMLLGKMSSREGARTVYNAFFLHYVQQFWSGKRGSSGPCSPIVQAETIKFSLVWIGTATCAAGSTCTECPAEFSSSAALPLEEPRDVRWSLSACAGMETICCVFFSDRLVFTVVSVCLSSQKLNSGKAWQQKAESTSFIRYLQWHQIADPSYRKKHLYWRKHLKILTKL